MGNIEADRFEPARWKTEYPNPAFEQMDAATWGPADGAGYRYAIASIRTVQTGYPNWAQPVRVTLRERQGRVDVVAIDRASGNAGRSETD